ncbi:hypothetical protein E2C01_082329 [Portunus trituberculatus]|uniref:Uncharacterized protein n=1 Tax=Portunus trituberculatus TaxID=210409 RepID=A0A5B7J1C0_PORTR|nr:hypothetical protein [Portunus trituberculatus]
MGVRMAAKRRRGWLGDLSSHMMCRCALTFFGDVKVQSGKRLWWWGEAKGEPPDGAGRGTCTLERTGPHWPPRVPSLHHLRCYFQQQKCVPASQIITKETDTFSVPSTTANEDTDKHTGDLCGEVKEEEEDSVTTVAIRSQDTHSNGEVLST